MVGGLRTCAVVPVGEDASVLPGCLDALRTQVDGPDELLAPTLH